MENIALTNTTPVNIVLQSPFAFYIYNFSEDKVLLNSGQTPSQTKAYYPLNAIADFNFYSMALNPEKTEIITKTNQTIDIYNEIGKLLFTKPFPGIAAVAFHPTDKTRFITLCRKLGCSTITEHSRLNKEHIFPLEFQYDFTHEQCLQLKPILACSPQQNSIAFNLDDTTIGIYQFTQKILRKINPYIPMPGKPLVAYNQNIKFSPNGNELIQSQRTDLILAKNIFK